jgi:hypothetical protein
MTPFSSLHHVLLCVNICSRGRITGRTAGAALRPNGGARVIACYMCGQVKPEAEFAFADMAKGTRQRHCRKCHAAYRRAHYLANRDDYIRREVARMAGYRTENRALLLAYLTTHHCVDCGEDDPVVLDFDHRDPSLKRCEVGRLASRKPWADVWAEIQKCDVRCANCHRRRTAQQFSWGKSKRVPSQRRKAAHPIEPTPIERLELWSIAPAPETRRCCTCGETKPAEQFAMKDKSRNLRATKCRGCQRVYSREHYRRNRAKYISKAARRSKRERENNRQRLFDYLIDHPCIDCGETDPLVLDFDHRDSKTKRGTVSRLASRLSWTNLEREIAQCDVRCANCHRRRTAEQFNWARYIREAS